MVGVRTCVWTHGHHFTVSVGMDTLLLQMDKVVKVSIFWASNSYFPSRLAKYCSHFVLNIVAAY